MAQLILIVEDEPKLASLMSDYLKQASFSTHIIGDGAEVTNWVKTHSPDLILLDLMLPNKDGMTICKEIRAFSNTPVIMATAKVEEIDRLLGLEIGADDYVCKPFSYREVVARVKALLRRASISKETTTSNTNWDIDEQKYQAKLNGQLLDLTAVEFKLLSTLAKEPSRIFQREQLMQNIYQEYRVVSDRTIDSHIKKLRAKIKHVAGDQEIIHSVYGVGYKFEMP